MLSAQPSTGYSLEEPQPWKLWKRQPSPARCRPHSEYCAQRRVHDGLRSRAPEGQQRLRCIEVKPEKSDTNGAEAPEHTNESGKGDIRLNRCWAQSNRKSRRVSTIAPPWPALRADHI